MCALLCHVSKCFFNKYVKHLCPSIDDIFIGFYFFKKYDCIYNYQ